MEKPKHVIETEYGLRCRNCDSDVDENGHWIDDDEWFGEDPDECPDCGASLEHVR